MSFQQKEVYRSEIERLSKIVKLSVVCREVGISASALNYFVNHKRYELVSVAKLRQFIDFINDYC